MAATFTRTLALKGREVNADTLVYSGRDTSLVTGNACSTLGDIIIEGLLMHAEVYTPLLPWLRTLAAGEFILPDHDGLAMAAMSFALRMSLASQASVLRGLSPWYVDKNTPSCSLSLVSLLGGDLQYFLVELSSLHDTHSSPPCINRPRITPKYLTTPEWRFPVASRELPTFCAITQREGLSPPVIEVYHPSSGTCHSEYQQYTSDIGYPGCTRWASCQPPSCLVAITLLDQGHNMLADEVFTMHSGMNGETLLVSHTLTATPTHVEDVLARLVPSCLVPCTAVP